MLRDVTHMFGCIREGCTTQHHAAIFGVSLPKALKFIASLYRSSQEMAQISSRGSSSLVLEQSAVFQHLFP